MKIQQLLRDNAGRQKRPVNIVRNEAEASLYIYDVIDGYWGVSAAAVIDAIAAAGDATTLNVYINSPGGDVFEARAMMSAIANHPATFIAHIDGLAASAATMLVMACDESEISQGGFFMIHNAWTIAIGNKTDLRTTADLLEKVDNTIVDDYRKKTKKDEAQIREWMDAETWFSAEEAKANGFVDRIVEVVPTEGAEAEETEAQDRAWDLSAYEHAPAALKVSPAKAATAPSAEAVAAHRAVLERRLHLVERCAA